jgi:hypothetical protein
MELPDRGQARELGWHHGVEVIVTRALRVWASTTLACALLVSTSGVRADMVVSIHVMQGTSAWSGGLHSSDEEPDVLAAAAPRLTGTTPTTEFGLQVAGISESTRFGLGETLFLPRELMVQLSPLPRDFEARPGTAWGGRIEGFLGREFGRHAGMTPWVDLCAGVSMLSASLTLHHATLGGLGETHYMRVDPIVAPRIGLRVPFSDYGVLEFFARRDLLGPDRLFLGVAIAVTTFHTDGP